MKFNFYYSGQITFKLLKDKLRLQIYYPRFWLGNIENCSGSRKILHVLAATVFLFDYQNGRENPYIQCGFKILGFGIAFDYLQNKA